MRYIIIWDVLSKSLYIYTLGDTRITEMDSATGSIYFGDPVVDRHHLIIRNTHYFLPSFEVHLKITMWWTQGYTPSLWSSEFGNARQGRDRASLDMHLEAAIERFRKCTWRPWLSEFGNAIGSHDRASSEMQLEAAIEQRWWCTWRPWSSKFGDALGGHDRARLEKN